MYAEAMPPHAVRSVKSIWNRATILVQKSAHQIKIKLQSKLVQLSAMLLACLTAVAAITSHYAQNEIMGLMRNEALRDAKHWGETITQTITLDQHAAHNLGENLIAQPKVLEYAQLASVFKMKIFDANGNLITRRKIEQVNTTIHKDHSHHTAQGMHHGHHRTTQPATKSELERRDQILVEGLVKKAIASGNTVVRFVDDMGQHHTGRCLSSAYVPLIKDGRKIGAIGIYFDQSRQHHAYIEKAQATSFALSLIAILVFGLPSFAFLFRTQQANKASERASFLASHDALTGLPNRAFYQAHGTMAVERASKLNKVGLICLDLDGFKAVNDTLGHDVGDELLQEVANRLRQCARTHDAIARLGGDEFVIVLDNISNIDVCRKVAERILETFEQELVIHGHTVRTGASIGLSIAPDFATNLEGLYKNADIAMYLAKRSGRGQICVYAEGMDAELQERRRLEHDLRQAIQRNEFSLVYQPQVRSQCGAIQGFEALLRWTHPERGPIGPNVFIPVCEEIGMIEEIGRWVLERSCIDAMNWNPDYTVAVNISALHLVGEHIIDDVQNALSVSGLGANRLELEITESVLLQDVDKALLRAKELKDIGVSIAMDDFGTGYSSLSYLQQFPFDKIKIDRSFVKSIETSPDAAAIVRAVIGMSKSMGKTTIAEGIETCSQKKLLLKEGCDELQGYLFSKPIPVGEITQLENELSARYEAKRLAAQTSH